MIAKDRWYFLVMFLWILNTALRFVFGVMSITEGNLLDIEVAVIVTQTITVMFIALGILGLAAILGMLLMKSWGFKIALVTSLITIAFDIWGVTLQFTAAMGFIVPAVMLVYLGMHRSQL